MGNRRIGGWPGIAALVFGAGVLTGVLIGRASARGPVGDLLTSLTLIVVGLMLAIALVWVGSQLAGPERSAREGRVPATETAEEQPVVDKPPVSDAPDPSIHPIPLAPQVEEPRATALFPLTTATEVIPAHHAPLIDSRIAFYRSDGHLVLRMRDLLGYSNLRVAVSFDAHWLTRLGTAEGRREFASGLSKTEVAALVLFVLALGVYTITRLWKLEQFPIYFFTDEAIGPVLGTELAQRGFVDGQGNLFPAFFQNGLYWNLSLSVYLHALTATLLGKSILITRLTSTLISLSGAVAVGLILKWFFKLKYWWLGVLLLAATPAWFLHSRTAFETVLMVSFYSWFLLFYLLYRHRSPRYIFPMLVFAAATFYSYSNGQAIIGLSGILFLLSDLRYHLKHWRTGMLGLGFVLLLAVPYLRFRLQHPDVVAYHLRILDSYWLLPISFTDKLGRFASTYLYGLSPQYWFFPNEHDLIRHRMKGYGYIPWWMLPFFLLGIAVALRRWNSPTHRAVLIGMLVAPFGSALADIAITRALLFVVPAAILAALGAERAIDWIRRRPLREFAAGAAFVIPAAMSLFMLYDAVTNGPIWYDNYGLYGMQWGTRELFLETVPKLLDENPDSPIYVTHTWANGTDIFMRFFDVDPTRVVMVTIDAWMAKKLTLEPNAIFIMSPEEYQKAATSPKFKDLSLISTIPYPNGNAGFYVAQLQYADNVDQLFAQEAEAKRQLVTESVVIDGQTAELAHTQFDMGNASTMFDGDPYTVSRGVEANPLILDFRFPQPRSVKGLDAHFGKANINLKAFLFAQGVETPVQYEKQFDFLTVSSEFPAGPLAQIDFATGPAAVSRMRLEIRDTNSDENAHIHVFEMQLR